MTHPAGGRWHYEPNHDYVAHLDDVFRQGNAPRLAGMLLSLASPSIATGIPTPCYLDIPAMVPFTPNDGEFNSYEVTGSGQIGVDVYSILQGSARKDPMPDLAVEQFFYHADVLSGQDVGKLRPHLGTKLDRLDLTDGGFAERAVVALDSTRTGDTTSIWADLVGTFPADKEGGIWRHWKGQASDEAWEKFRHVRLWFHQEASDGVFRQDALREMAAVLVKYVATIHGARMNLDNLMGELVDQVNAWNDKTSVNAAAGKWVVLSQIKNLADKTPIGRAFALVDEVAKAADTYTSEKKLEENQVYGKLAAYLSSAEGIVQDTAGEIKALVRELNNVRKDRHRRDVDIPVWSE